jgi:DNA-binding transcriptional ArsR family regulator
MEETKRQLTKKGEPMTTFVPRLSKDGATIQADMFLILRNKTRLRIIDLLSRYGGLLCVGEIAEVLEEHASVISRHFALLRAVKLVSREKHGIFAYYVLNADIIDVYRQFLEQYAFPHGVSL